MVSIRTCYGCSFNYYNAQLHRSKSPNGKSGFNILFSVSSETDQVGEAQKLESGAYVKKPYIMEKISVAIWDELNR